MLFRLALTLSFLFAAAIMLVVPLCAQEGNRINIFEQKKINPAATPVPPRPKADEATRQLLQEASSEFSTNFDDPKTYLMFFGFFLILFLLAVLIYNIDARYREAFKPGYANPNTLFRELCAAHRLTLRERFFLKRFADESELEGPLTLFVEPQHFLSALQDSHFATSQEMIRYFLVKLFDIHGESDVLPDEETMVVTPSNNETAAALDSSEPD